MDKKYAFICSGGGVPAIESIGGMIEALRYERNIVPSKIWACSGGTIPAVLCSKNIDMLEFFNTYYKTDLIKFRGILHMLFTSYLYDSTKIDQILKDLLGDETLDDVIVNATDKISRVTYYMKANKETVKASMSIPEVFKSCKITGDAKAIEINYNNDTQPRTTNYYDVHLENAEVVDGGIYDNVPVPPNKDLEEFDKVFILLCSDSKSNNLMSKSKILRSVANIFSAYEREFTDIIRTYADDSRFVVLRPPKIDAPLLDWSNELCCYHNAYNYIKNISF